MNRCLKKIGLLIFLCGLIFPSLISSSFAKEKNDSSSTTVRIGFLASLYSDVDLNDTRAAIEHWFDLIYQKHFISKTFILNDLDAVFNAIKSKTLDFITVTSIDYLKIKERPENFFFEPMMIGAYHDGKPTEKYILLVRKDASIKTLKDLKGKKILLEVGRRGIIGQLWLDTILLKEGLPESKDYLNTIKKVENAQQLVLPVFFKQANACVVASRPYLTMIELNPQLESELIPLNTSEEFLNEIMCSTGNLNQKDINDLLEIAFSFHKKPEAKQTLILFKVDQILPFQESYLKNLRDLVKEHDEFKNKNL